MWSPQVLTTLSHEWQGGTLPAQQLRREQGGTVLCP